MKDNKLKESASDELTHAASILEMIINDNVTPNTHMFNSIESVVGNINRAKMNISNIGGERKIKNIGDILITKNENLESAVGSILSVLEMAISLSASDESSNKNGNQVSIINLIFVAKLNLETVYEKISFN